MGNPLWRGLDFYRRLIELEQRYNTRRLLVHNAIQTNGMVIDRVGSILCENGFLVGLSLDGNKEANDRYRLDGGGKGGSYHRILQAAQPL